MKKPSAKRKQLLEERVIINSPSCDQCQAYDLCVGEEMLWCVHHKIYVYPHEFCKDFEHEGN